jgi:hypothetical protein
MFHFRTAPFVCAYRREVLCPVSTALSTLDPQQQTIVEALPCGECPHYVDSAVEALRQRRVAMGRLGRTVLALARQQTTPFYPVTWALRTATDSRVNLLRLWKAVQRLVRMRAVVAMSLPTLVPRARNRQQYVLRETLWVHVTAVGRVLADHTFGLHGARWRREQQRIAQLLAEARDRVRQTDLMAVYVQHLVALLSQFTTHVMAATDAVIATHCTTADAPYVNALLHLEQIAPTACAEVDRVFLTAQESRRRAFAHGRPVVQ